MPVVRTYLCDECTERTGSPFTFDKLHFDRSEPPPECPGCRASSVQIPSGFNISGNASRAGAIAEDILRKDYGLSDWKDKSREGDIAFKTPPHLQKAVENMWQPGGGIIEAAKVGARAAAAEGSNPLALMQRRAKANGPKYRVPVSVVSKG